MSHPRGSQTLRSRSEARLLGPLRLASLLLVVATMACLSPQEIELDVPPEEVNLPPVFDPTRDASPQGAVICVSGLDETAIEFRIDNLRDENGQKLEARWFIDYEGGFVAVQKSQTLSRSADEAVYPPATLLSSEIDPYHRTLGRPFFVEVVVSDGFAPADTTPRNRAVQDSAYAVNYRWVVNYKAGAPCE